MIGQGTILNNTYQIIEEIGAGGGGVVYKAQHLRLDTLVVVKRIKDEVVGHIAARGEADILKQLKHSYLPRIYDFIEEEDGIYTVMDYIPGQGLDKILAANSYFSQELILKWARQLGEALAYLHSLKPEIVHSDIKPANIIITPEGNVCLIDFNISTASDEGGRRMSIGFSAGYSAPEQYRTRTTPAYVPTSALLNTKPDYISQEEATELLNQQVYQTEGMQYHVGSEDETEMLTSMSANQQTGANSSFSKMKMSSSFNQSYPAQGATPVATPVAAPSPMHGGMPYGYGTPAATPVSMGPSVTYQNGYVDKRSDIYSLGCVLYHLATGMSPGRDFRRVVPLHETNTHVSEGLIFIIEKMMQLDPEQRFQDGVDFLSAINNCYKFDRRYIAQRRKEKTLLAIASILIIVGGGLIGGGMAMRNLGNTAEFESAILEADEYAENGQFEEAFEILDDCKDMKSVDGKELQREVYYLFLSGQYDECIDRGEEILAEQLLSKGSQKQNLAEVYYLVGNAYYEKEEFKDAVKCFNSAIEKVDTEAVYYRDLCVSYAKLNHLDKADDALRAAKERDLAEDSIYYAKGEIERAQGNNDVAIKAFKKVREMTDDFVLKKRATLVLSKILLETGRLDENIELLESALLDADNQERVVLKDSLATAYMRKGEQAEFEDEKVTCFDKAASLYEELINSGFATWQTKENLAILREEAKQFDKAMEVLLKMAEDYPNDYRVYKRLAFLEADIQQQKPNENRDYTAMKEYYDKAVELYDESINEQEMQMLDTYIEELREGNWFR